ncbi:MAG: DUF4143 domain-containing protein [Gammaproteobacteria bacterium]
MNDYKPTFWGRLTESAVGAHLTNTAAAGDCALYYWRERNQEVDFVVETGQKLTAVEVKSGRATGVQRHNDFCLGIQIRTQPVSGRATASRWRSSLASPCHIGSSDAHIQRRGR